MSASLKPLSLGEFLDWERTQPERYEFDGIQPVARTGGSVAHARLVRRLVRALGARLRPGSEAFGGDLKVLTTGRVRYPDVTVVCGPTDSHSDTVEPAVVFEVLSPSSVLADLRVKAGEYAAVRSILHYVVLEQQQPKAVTFSRRDNWREIVLAGHDAMLVLEEVGVELSLSSVYG